jgi:hypothetical protein
MTLDDINTLGHADFKRDRWGRPLVEPKGGGKAKPYTRSSSAAKTVEDTFNLELWQRRNIAYGMAQDSSLIARVLATPGTPAEWDQAAKKQINDICEAAAAVAQAHKAADIGTALHAMIEQVNLGQHVNAGPYEADLAAYRAAIEQMGWTIQWDHVECRMVCDDLQMAGTCDMLVADPDGNHYVADLKTSASVDYGGLGWSAQLASYAHSDLYDPMLNVRLQTPDINKAVGYIVHLPAGQGVCTIHEVDLVKGYAAAELANLIRKTRNESKKYISPVQIIAHIPDVQESVQENVSEPIQIDVSDLRARVKWLIDNGHGDKAMQQWPEGVPTFKQGGHTSGDADKIAAFLRRIEAQVEAPFPSAPPTEKPAKVREIAAEPSKLDEGAQMPAEAIAALAERYGALSKAQREILRTVSAEAHAIGYSLNVILNPCERRYWITEALVRWSNYGWDGDVILAAIHKITEATGTAGVILATMSTQHAEQLAELATALTEERVTLAFGPDGITFTEQETS